MLALPVRLLSMIARWSALLSAVTAGAAVLAMTLLITADVLGRYLFNKPMHISVEISGYLLVALVFLGLGYTESKDRHIILTFLIDTFPHRLKKTIWFVNSAVSVLFSGWLTWLTLQPVIQDYGLGSISLTGLRTPQWIPELLIPTGLAILTVQLLAKLALGITPSREDSSTPSPV